VQHCIDEWVHQATELLNQNDPGNAPYQLSVYGTWHNRSVANPSPPEGWPTRYQGSKYMVVWLEFTEEHSRPVYGGRLIPLVDFVEYCPHRTGPEEGLGPTLGTGPATGVGVPSDPGIDLPLPGTGATNPLPGLDLPPLGTGSQPPSAPPVLPATQPKPKVPGDCDRDGKLTVKDALCALRMSVNLLRKDPDAADMDGDRSITSNDARLILLEVLRQGVRSSR
jgi:hypothetical protein